MELYTALLLEQGEIQLDFELNWMWVYVNCIYFVDQNLIN